jgi:hypothetical protein
MRKDKTERLFFIIGILVCITPFLGFPSRIENWIIAFYGFIIIAFVVYKYFKFSTGFIAKNEDREHKVESDTFEERKPDVMPVEITQNVDVELQETSEKVEEEEIMDIKEDAKDINEDAEYIQNKTHEEKEIPSAKDVLADLMKQQNEEKEQ